MRISPLVLATLLASAPLTAQDAYLKPSSTYSDGRFGEVVACSDDTLAVSAGNGFGVFYSTPGARVTVFARWGSSWVEEAVFLSLQANGPSGPYPPPPALVASLALDGNTLVAGFPSAGPLFSPSVPIPSGEAAVYDRYAPGVWNRTILLPRTPSLGAFGSGVAVSGDTLVVGMFGEPHVFVRSGSSWVLQATLTSTSSGYAEAFGASVGISGDTIVVGAPATDSYRGAAHVFVRNGVSWSEQAVLTAPSRDPGDRFGDPCAISGDTVVVGVPLEDSSATGIDGDDTDDSSPEAGAAYVFTRSGSTWSLEAYVKASNTDAGDEFGTTVAVHGDTLLVGAPYEGSAATGINGDQDDNSSPGAGAAYLFDRIAGTWSQRLYLKASNTDPGDRFGSVSLGSTTALVGADMEDSGETGVNGTGLDNLVVNAGAAYVYEVGAGAAALFRNAGANPTSYAIDPPVLGSTLAATVDLAGTTGHSLALLVGFLTPLAQTLSGGQVLLVNVSDPAGELLFQQPSPGPIASFTIPLPPSAAFVGLTVSTQAVHLGGVLPFALSNAQDLVLGL